MRFFAFSQLLTYLILISPPSLLFRGLLVLFWAWGVKSRMTPAVLGCAWQYYQLHDALPLRCDDRFWFICSSDKASLFVSYLQQTALGEAAVYVRTWTYDRCMAWHPFWGAFAFSLIMGGQPEERLKSLYKSLGFLHVLVISGSQFTLLAAWLRTLMRWPAHILYSSLIVDWKIFRSLALIADFLSLLGLLVYLLACGASPPCQRAFLQQVLMSGRKWCGPPRYKGKGSRAEGVLFRSQMMLFPDAWFSLSNLLSWGAVSALSMFHKTRSFTAQLKTSLGIQLLSLAIFSRLSISALLFDFFLTPFWDVLLVICLAGIFVPELSIHTTLIRVLDYFHDGLWVIEAWQVEFFGSSALSFRPYAIGWGRLVAGIACVALLLSHRAERKTQAR